MRPIARHSLTCAVILLTLAACIPSQTPPRSDVTPGAPVVVSGDVYDAGVFRARYPAGWRVITSPAGEPPFVTFVAPDACALIVLSVEPRPAPPLGAACTEPDNPRTVNTETGGQQAIYMEGRAAGSVYTAFIEDWQRVLSSVTTP